MAWGRGQPPPHSVPASDVEDERRSETHTAWDTVEELEQEAENTARPLVRGRGESPHTTSGTKPEGHAAISRGSFPHLYIPTFLQHIVRFHH